MNWEEFLDPYIQAVGELKLSSEEFVSNFVSKNAIHQLNL
ncbi:hypothetical protein SMU36_08577 [Streptococcus mutans 4VF1]|nr:hypothetical protein SMU36_08577 [Streptococcus mutans 4VF1]